MGRISSAYHEKINIRYSDSLHGQEDLSPEQKIREGDGIREDILISDAREHLYAPLDEEIVYLHDYDFDLCFFPSGCMKMR